LFYASEKVFNGVVSQGRVVGIPYIDAPIHHGPVKSPSMELATRLWTDHRVAEKEFRDKCCDTPPT
jgi:hypothetical protein